MNILFVGKNRDFKLQTNFTLIQKKYMTKTGGFSGTLDPFASGTLIIALGDIPRLFQFFEKSEKVYRATLWLGAKSESLDIDTDVKIDKINQIEIYKIIEVLESLIGNIRYFPPKYSAKIIDGQRAYNLARDGKNVNLKEIESNIFNIKFINYAHPFLTFEITVSEGSYIRSFGKIIAEKLGTTGILSNLERIREGDFIYNNEAKLNPLEYLQKDFRENIYLRDKRYLFEGGLILLSSLKYQDIGRYYMKYDIYIALIEIIEINGEKKLIIWLIE